MTSTENSVGMSEANAPKPLPLEALERLKRASPKFPGSNYRIVAATDLRSLLTSYEAQGERLREVEGAGLKPLTDDEAVAALCDSSYRAGALAGWNAAMHDDPAKGEEIMAQIRRVEPGSLRPILQRTAARAALTQPPAMDGGQP